MKRAKSVLLASLWLASSVYGAPKNKTYNVPADVLYENAVQVAAQNYKLGSSDLTHQQFTFHVNASATSFGLEIRAAVHQVTGDSSQLTLDMQNSDSKQLFSWGAGGRAADKFFKDVDDALATWRAVDYRFVMTKPTENSDLVFEDDILRIAFSISRKAVGFTLANKTELPLKLDWNQVSYIDADGKSHKVFHQGVAYKDRESSLPASLIPPTAKFDDVVLPSDMSEWNEAGGGFYSLDLLPHSTHAANYLGKTISVFMQLDTGSGVKNYLFSFRVTQADIKNALLMGSAQPGRESSF